MANGLFFLPILVRALVQTDLKQALLKAFAQIRQLGEREEYRIGFEQFLFFIARIDQESNRNEDPYIISREALGAIACELALTRNSEPLREVSLDAYHREVIFSGIKPGLYVLQLFTGRIIWQAQLGAKDLIWTQAFPGRPLALAADTGAGEVPTTQTVDLLGGELVLQIHPGPECGQIVLTWNNRDA